MLIHRYKVEDEDDRFEAIIEIEDRPEVHKVVRDMAAFRHGEEKIRYWSDQDCAEEVAKDIGNDLMDLSQRMALGGCVKWFETAEGYCKMDGSSGIRIVDMIPYEPGAIEVTRLPDREEVEQ